MKIKWKRALAAGLLCAASPTVAAEIINVDFTRADGGISTRQYRGVVNVQVSGIGQSRTPLFGDAFYIFPAGLFGHDPQYYQLTFGLNELVPFNPDQNAKNFIIGGLPAFQENNVYRFRLDTGATTPSFLHFGVGDGDFSDNFGSYTVALSIPEPANWAMMIGGFMLVGAAARKRRERTVTA